MAAEVTAAILDTNPDRVSLEPWAPRRELIWRFNALYWQALVAGRRRPAGTTSRRCPVASDARNVGAARETILDLFAIWDELASGGRCPSSSTSSSSASATVTRRDWLDEFASSTAGTAATTTGGCTT